MVLARMTVGCPWCFEAASKAAKTLNGSWPPRFSAQMSSSERSATRSFSSGVLKKCSRTWAALRPGLVLGEQRVPVAAPDHLDDVPAGAAEGALQLLDDLAVAAHRPVEPLQVAVHDEDEVVELLAAGH